MARDPFGGPAPPDEDFDETPEWDAEPEIPPAPMSPIARAARSPTIGEPEIITPGGGTIILDPKAPLATARIIVDRQFQAMGLRALHHQQGVFTEWTGTYYREYATEEMRSNIYAFLEKAFVEETNAKLRDKFPTRPYRPTARAVSDVLDALRAAAQLDGVLRAPAWLGETDTLPPPTEIISCANGLLHLPTGTLIPHTPKFYSRSSVGYDYDPHAAEPTEWLKFLASIWPSDIDARATLQDIFGYLLGTDTDQQKIPMIVGPKRSGKGTIARVLTALLGSEAVVSPTLASLEKNFGLAPLIGKSVALIADARLSGRADSQAIAERLLSISGEDMQTIDRKHVSAWSGKLSARFFIMTNELPRIDDASGALASRFLIITMTNSFFGQEDHGLTNRLLNELPGILNWAIDGWRNLKARGYFKPPASSLEAMNEIELLSSPITAFVRDRCVIQAGKSCKVDELYAAWVQWCDEQGRDKPGTKAILGRNLKSVAPGVKVSQHRVPGDRDRYYEGIGITVTVDNQQSKSSNSYYTERD